MKRLFFFLIFIFSVLMTFAQEESAGSLLLRKQGRLTFENASEKLSDAEVQSLLSNDDFSIYQAARKQYRTAIPLWATYATLHATALSLLTAGIIWMPISCETRKSL